MATDTSSVASAMLQCCQCPALFVRPVDLQTHLLLHQTISAILPDTADLSCYNVDQSVPTILSSSEPNLSAQPSMLSVQTPSSSPWNDPLSLWPTLPQPTDMAPASAHTGSGAPGTYGTTGTSSNPGTSRTSGASGTLGTSSVPVTSGTAGTCGGTGATTLWLSDHTDSGSQPPVLNLSTSQWSAEERAERQRLGGSAAAAGVACVNVDTEPSTLSQYPAGLTSPISSHALSSVVAAAPGVDILYTDESLQSSCCSSPPPPPLSMSHDTPHLAGSGCTTAAAYISEPAEREQGVEQYQSYSYPLEALSHCLLSFASSSAASSEAISASSDPTSASICPAEQRCVCGRVFTTPTHLTHHALTCSEHQQRQYVCRACQQPCASLNQLLIHTEHAHSRVSGADGISGVFSCGVCGGAFATAHERYCHIASHLASPLLQPPLSAGAVGGDEPPKVLSSCGSRGRFGCVRCSAVFAHKSSLIRHRRRAHPAVPRPRTVLRYCHTCDTCGRGFSSARRLRWHAEIHARKPHVCAQCGRRFLHRSWLTRHKRRQHPSSPQIPPSPPTAADLKFTSTPKSVVTSTAPATGDSVHCPICLRLYTRSSLRRHVQMVHERLQPYQCTRCQRRFAAKCNLAAHQLSHLSQHERPHRCAVCARGYATQRDLARHVAAAHQPARLACDVCGRQFTQRKSLTAHMHSHSVVKKFQCAQCGREFARKAYLTAHMRVHTGERPHACPVCERSFASRSNYNVHVRNHARRTPVTAEM